MTFSRMTVKTISSGVLAASLLFAAGAFAQDVSKDAPKQEPVTAPAAAAPEAAAATPPAAAGAAPAKVAQMERLKGVWVEGGGYVIKYGENYDACAKRCLDDKSCLMIEYYRPEKKCNLYKEVRPLLKGGDADVAVRK
jgi:hypothetical protein